MRTKTLLICSAAVVALMTAGCGQQQVSFAKDVKPILDKSCLTCHDGKGEGSKKTDFLVTSYADVMKGTAAGPVVTPGSSVSSTLFRVVSHLTNTKIQMPPHHDTSLATGRGEPLTEKAIETIGNWIDQGALDN